MDKILQGVRRFHRDIFQAQRPLFEKLVHAQSPRALFITCSDSRINPNLITQTEPGDLFVVRNAGNIVPAHGSASGGESATIEYAVAVLKVKHVILCGHTQCGAMKALMHSEKARDLPAVRGWFAHAETTRRLITENFGSLTPEEQVPLAIRQNVLVQLDNLRTHPSVAVALSRRELQVHGWIYKLETGEVLAFDPELGQFRSVLEDEVPTEPNAPAASTSPLPPGSNGSHLADYVGAHSSGLFAGGQSDGQ